MKFTPPHGSYAVIFTSLRTDGDAGYSAMAERMVALAAEQSGFLGVRSARGDDGLGITVSYWDSLESIAAWRAHAEHRPAREQGRAQWYAHYELKVERAYSWSAEAGSADPMTE
jgi:heme-degrading monooxygenase HmoA